MITPANCTFQAVARLSPNSASLIDSNGHLVLTEDAAAYVSRTFMSDNDPYVVIHWALDNLAAAIQAYHDQVINNAPILPGWLDATNIE